MGTTAMEARDNVCLLVLVNPNQNSYEKCCPEACSVWSWEEGCNASGTGSATASGGQAPSAPAIG